MDYALSLRQLQEQREGNTTTLPDLLNLLCHYLTAIQTRKEFSLESKRLLLSSGEAWVNTALFHLFCHFRWIGQQINLALVTIPTKGCTRKHEKLCGNTISCTRRNKHFQFSICRLVWQLTFATWNYLNVFCITFWPLRKIWWMKCMVYHFVIDDEWAVWTMNQNTVVVSYILLNGGRSHAFSFLDLGRSVDLAQHLITAFGVPKVVICQVTQRQSTLHFSGIGLTEYNAAVDQVNQIFRVQWSIGSTIMESWAVLTSTLKAFT